MSRLSSLNFLIEVRASSLNVSPISMQPIRLVDMLTPMMVYCFSSFVFILSLISWLILTSWFSNHCKFPTFISPLIESNSPEIPWPVSVIIFLIGNKFIFCFFASSIRDFAIGCLLSFSKLADICRRKVSSLLPT